MAVEVGRRLKGVRLGIAGRAALAVAGALFVALWGINAQDRDALGWNGAGPTSFVATLRTGETLCEPAPSVRRPADHIQLTVGLSGRNARIQLSSGRGNRNLAVVSVAGSGPVDIPFAINARTAAENVCLKNIGAGPVALAGEPLQGAEFAGKLEPYTVSLIALGPKQKWRQSFKSLIRGPGDSQGFPGVALGGLVMVLAVGAAVTALATAVRNA